jgi:hypothetical protein
MKISIRGILITGVLALGPTVMPASPDSSWIDQWHQAKHGFTTERTKATGAQAMPTSEFLETWYRAKLGRNSPMEESRLKAERESTAFREASPAVMPANDWLDRWNKAKLGRSAPTR